jgi:hypothetical protein
MKAETVSGAMDTHSILAQLTDQEDFAAFSNCESFKSGPLLASQEELCSLASTAYLRVCVCVL